MNSKTMYFKFKRIRPFFSKSALSCNFIGRFLRGRSLKGRCNICVYVPVCVPVCVCVCVPRLPPMIRPILWGWTAEFPPHLHMTPHPRSRIRTRKQLHDLPLGRTTLKKCPILIDLIIRTGANPVILGASVAPCCQCLLPGDSLKLR